MPTENDISKMKVADLKRELKIRGLTTTGNKTELQDRLQTALLDGDISLEDTVISGEELLDEDAVLTDEEEDKILNDENELLKSPTESTLQMSSPLRSMPTTGLADNEIDVKKAKKVVLKRQNSLSIKSPTAVAVTGTITTKENTEHSPAKAIKISNHVPITMDSSENNSTAATTTTTTTTGTTPTTAKSNVAQLNQQQKLEMRAKKFGISSIPSATTNTNKKNDIGGISGIPTIDLNSETQIEVLKKRAERFGVVSPQIAKIDAAEKLIKRKERFGVGASTTTTTTTTNTTTTAAAAAAAANETKEDGSNTEKSTINYAEKARLRLERFKTSTSSTTTTTPTATAVTAIDIGGIEININKN